MRIYPGTTVDYEFATLGGLGYTGTLNDRQFAALRAEGLTGSLPDMFGQFDGELGGGTPDYEALMAEFMGDDGHMVIDMSYLTNMWQEDTKATQVSAAGQTVGAVDTKYGNTARTMQQTTALARPLWHESGFSVFDGVNDGWGAAANALSLANAVNGFTSTMLVYPTAGGVVQGLVGIGTNTSNVARFVLQINADGAITLQLRRLDADLIQSIISSAGVIVPNNYYTITARVNYLTGVCSINVNGDVVASGTLTGTDGVNGTSATNSNRCRVFINVASTPNYFVGYAGNVVLARKYLSDEEVDICEAWCRNIIEEGGAFRLGGGARTWFNSPVALVDGDSTYVTAAQDDGSTSRILVWDTELDTAKLAHITSTPAGDDHAEGAIIKLADNSFLNASVGHNVANYYIGLGATPFDLTETNIDVQLGSSNYSYANIFQLSNGHIHMFGRTGVSGAWQIRHSSSTNGGVTWSTYTNWLWTDGNQRPYLQYSKSLDGTRINFILTDGLPGEATTNNVYAGYMDSAGDFFDTDDNPVTTPAQPSDFALVFDATVNDDAWTWDLKEHSVGTTGAIVSFPTTTEHRYHRITFRAGVWASEVVVTDAGQYLYAGQPYYSGGICCHPTNPDIMYAAIEDGGGIYQINRMDRVSEGSWTATPLTTGSVHSFRPDTQTGVLTFVRGVYTAYTDFAGCNIMGIKI